MTWSNGPQQPAWQPPGGPQPYGQPYDPEPHSAPPTYGGPPQGPPPTGPPPVGPPGSPSGSGKGPLIGGLVAAGLVLVLLVGVAVWVYAGRSAPDAKLDDTAAGGACDKQLAFIGTLSGKYGPLGVSALNGAKLAVDQFHKRHPDCGVKLVEFDTKDDSKTAAELAHKVADDPSIIGTVGPVYTIEAPLTAPVLEEAGVPMISPSATGTNLTGRGWKVFHRVIGNDSSQGPAAARYLEQIEARRVAVVTDTNPYFKDITKGVVDGLGSNALKTMTFDGGKPEFGKIIKYIKKSVIHAVYFSGYAGAAATFLKQLRAAKSTVRVLAPDTAYDSSIIPTAKRAKFFAVSCTCAPPDRLEERFRSDYDSAYGKPPGNYAAEAYDAATVFLKGVLDDRASRSEMLGFVDKFNDYGVTKRIRFDTKGEIAPRAPVWFYSVEGDGFTYDRRID